MGLPMPTLSSANLLGCFRIAENSGAHPFMDATAVADSNLSQIDVRRSALAPLPEELVQAANSILAVRRLGGSAGFLGCRRSLPGPMGATVRQRRARWRRTCGIRHGGVAATRRPGRLPSHFPQSATDAGGASGCRHRRVDSRGRVNRQPILTPHTAAHLPMRNLNAPKNHHIVDCRKHVDTELTDWMNYQLEARVPAPVRRRKS